MAIPEGLRTSLNAIRETSIVDGTLYHQYVPEILPDTDIGSFAAPIVPSSLYRRNCDIFDRFEEKEHASCKSNGEW